MNIKLTQISLLVYLILVSLITKKLQLIPFGVFIALFFLKSMLGKNESYKKAENLLNIIVALSPFPYILLVFLAHLPFSVFGYLLVKRNFIKNYILGFAISLVPTILLYTLSNYIGLRLNAFIISMFFYIPAFLAIFMSFKNRKNLDFIDINYKDYIIIMSILLAVVFVAINIVNNSSLFMANSTYMFSRFDLIVKSIKSSGTFPIYDPAVAQGEPPFLFEAPLFFSHIAFVNSVLEFIPSVLFYNAFSFFSLLLSVLALSELIKSLLAKVFGEDGSLGIFSTIIVVLGSVSIGLNFLSVQVLESFKQFFAFPINYLIFSVIIDRLTTPKEIITILYLIILTFIIHPPHGVGIVLIAFSLFFLMLINKNYSKDMEQVKSWIFNNKLKAVLALLLLASMALFYVTPTLIFKNFLEDNRPTKLAEVPRNTIHYFAEFISLHEYISLKYPDIKRIDDHRFGLFISLFGILSLAIVLFLCKLKSMADFRLFLMAYLLHFFISSLIISFPIMGNMEYGYRTAWSYLLILMVVSICAVIALVRQKHVKIFLLLVFFISVAYALPLAKRNIENIHKEKFISGIWQNEVEFIKSLPNDGRIITYGMYANIIDPGMEYLTGKYFSRHHLPEFARSMFIYSKIHSSDSFGQSDTLLSMSGAELRNYLVLGGYKYVFMDLRHPVSIFVAKILYPDYTAPIYQNQNLLILLINNTSYVEKVSVVKDVKDEMYKRDDGYKYVMPSRFYKFKNVDFSEKVIEPEGLDFKRISPVKVEIYGDFKENDYVVFKEAYFPRWKAYMNGKETDILGSNNNLILIKTSKGNKIEMEYKALPIEKFFGALSALSSLVLILLFIALLKK